MPIQRPININKSGSTVTFSPNPLQAHLLDQIFWTNNDTQPHWPGLVNTDGSINTTFFMPNQIAGNGDPSPIFSPTSTSPAGQTGPYNYKCSLPGHENETGTITVS